MNGPEGAYGNGVVGFRVEAFIVPVEAFKISLSKAVKSILGVLLAVLVVVLMSFSCLAPLCCCCGRWNFLWNSGEK